MKIMKDTIQFFATVAVVLVAMLALAYAIDVPQPQAQSVITTSIVVNGQSLTCSQITDPMQCGRVHNCDSDWLGGKCFEWKSR
jgi:hypothetical protein